jgi:methylthioribose-1-phosphate isomerase
MDTDLKTTIEISDALLEEARRVAARDRTTVRSLIEEGLRIVLDRAHVGDCCTGGNLAAATSWRQ